jgi:hypothetical protein
MPHSARTADILESEDCAVCSGPKKVIQIHNLFSRNGFTEAVSGFTLKA